MVPPHRARLNSVDPGYESVPAKREPDYAVVRDPGPGYSKVNKKPRAAPAARLPPGYSGQENGGNHYESLAGAGAGGPGWDESGYETIPQPGVASRGPSDPGYETIPGGAGRAGDLASEAASSTDPDYARLKDADIEFIDDSADEVDDELGRLQAGEC